MSICASAQSGDLIDFVASLDLSRFDHRLSSIERISEKRVLLVGHPLIDALDLGKDFRNFIDGVDRAARLAIAAPAARVSANARDPDFDPRVAARDLDDVRAAFGIEIPVGLQKLGLFFDDEGKTVNLCALAGNEQKHERSGERYACLPDGSASEERGGDRGLLIRGAQSVDAIPIHVAGEGVALPFRAIAERHGVVMSKKTEGRTVACSAQAPHHGRISGGGLQHLYVHAELSQVTGKEIRHLAVVGEDAFVVIASDGNELPGQRDELVSLDALVHRCGKLGMCRDHRSQSREPER